MSKGRGGWGVRGEKIWLLFSNIHLPVCPSLLNVFAFHNSLILGFIFFFFVSLFSTPMPMPLPPFLSNNSILYVLSRVAPTLSPPEHCLSQEEKPQHFQATSSATKKEKSDLKYRRINSPRSLHSENQKIVN